MKRNIARFLSAVMALCLCLGLVACGGNDNAGNGGNGGNAGTGDSTGEVRDTLNYGLNQEPDSLDPQNDNLLVTMLTNKQIYDTLLYRNDTTGELEPNIATEWEWVDDLTLSVTIRDDVTFHNGEKLTAEDVAFTIQRCTTGNASAALFASFDAENTKAIDETHVEIKLKQPYGAALNLLSNMKSAIVCKSYCESVDETTFGREPVGSGPFSFVEWVSGDHITLTRNDNYWGQKPSYTTLNLRVLTDATARAIELETGGVDIIDTMNDSDITRFQESENIEVYLIPGTKIHYLTFNQNDTILSNEKVRLAFAHAIDPAIVTQAGFGDSAEVASSSMATTIWGYKNVGQYTYDVELAKQLLSEAGYPDGFTCSIVVPNMSSNTRMAETMQAMLSEIGVTMEIETYDAATWNAKSRDGSAQLTINNLTVDSYDPDQNYMNLRGSSGMLSLKWDDEGFNDLLLQGQNETDETKRAEIYSQVQDYVFEHAFIVPLDEPLINYATQPYVKGFVANAGVQPDLKLVYFE